MNFAKENFASGSLTPGDGQNIPRHLPADARKDPGNSSVSDNPSLGDESIPGPRDQSTDDHPAADQVKPGNQQKIVIPDECGDSMWEDVLAQDDQ